MPLTAMNLSREDQKALKEMAAWLVAGMALDIPYTACSAALASALWYLGTNEVALESRNGGHLFTVAIAICAYFAFDKPRKEQQERNHAVRLRLA